MRSSRLSTQPHGGLDVVLIAEDKMGAVVKATSANSTLEGGASGLRGIWLGADLRLLDCRSLAHARRASRAMHLCEPMNNFIFSGRELLQLGEDVKVPELKRFMADFQHKLEAAASARVDT